MEFSTKNVDLFKVETKLIMLLYYFCYIFISYIRRRKIIMEGSTISLLSNLQKPAEITALGVASLLYLSSYTRKKAVTPCSKTITIA